MIAVMVMSVFALAGCGDSSEDNSADLAYVQDKGTLVVGITDFAPMDYSNGDGWTGFDAELAEGVKKVLAVNKSERHLRGGMATKEKYAHNRCN